MCQVSPDQMKPVVDKAAEEEILGTKRDCVELGSLVDDSAGVSTAGAGLQRGIHVV